MKALVTKLSPMHVLSWARTAAGRGDSPTEDRGSRRFDPGASPLVSALPGGRRVPFDACAQPLSYSEKAVRQRRSPIHGRLSKNPTGGRGRDFSFFFFPPCRERSQLSDCQRATSRLTRPRPRSSLLACNSRRGPRNSSLHVAGIRNLLAIARPLISDWRRARWRSDENASIRATFATSQARCPVCRGAVRASPPGTSREVRPLWNGAEKHSEVAEDEVGLNSTRAQQA
jgi:hypothetical protein